MKMKFGFSAGKNFAARLRTRGGRFAGSFGARVKGMKLRGRFGGKARNIGRGARAIGMGAYSAFRGSGAARRFGSLPMNVRAGMGIVGGVGLAGLAIKSYMEQKKSS